MTPFIRIVLVALLLATRAVWAGDQSKPRPNVLFVLVEGLDYSDYVRGGKNPSDGAAVISCAAPFGQWTRRAGGREYRGVRTVRYTYVRDLSGPWLLFDNLKDPGQMSNLLGTPGCADLQTKLDAILTRKLAEAHDEFLPAEKYIAKWGYTVDREGTVPYEP